MSHAVTTIKGILTHKLEAKAFLEGEAIQVKSVYSGNWLDTLSPWFFEGIEYRVKPTQEDSST